MLRAWPECESRLGCFDTERAPVKQALRIAPTRNDEKARDALVNLLHRIDREEGEAEGRDGDRDGGDSATPENAGGEKPAT